MAPRIVELLITILLSFIIGLLSLIFYIYGLIKYGPSKWVYVKKRNERPEILDSEEYGVHHWVPLKNTRLKLHYVASGPEDKPLMLFLHGFPEFWFSWRHQLKEFSKDYRCVAVDLRGYGDSDKPKAISDYTIDKLSSDVDQLIHALGYRKCILAGHDWGGALAWHYAGAYPENVEKLIICNCPHPAAFQKLLRSSFTQLSKSWYMFLFQVPVLPILMLRVFDLRRIAAAFCGKSMGAKEGTFSDEVIEAYKYTFAEYSDLLGPVNFYRASLMAGDSLWPKIKIQCPTLMVWGTKDNALDKRLADLSGDHVNNYTVHYIEGASHWVQQEEPDQVNAFIHQFLQSD